MLGWFGKVCGCNSPDNAAAELEEYSTPALQSSISAGQAESSSRGAEAFRATLQHLEIPKGADVEYEKFEKKYKRLFDDPSGMLACVNEDYPMNFSNVVDVKMGELRVVEGSDAIIGTKGLAPCVAICARSVNRNGDPIFGLYHFDGSEEPRDALERVISEVSKRSAQQPEIWLIGGCKTAAPDEDDEDPPGTLDRSRNFVENYSLHNIKGIRLNISEYYEIRTQTGPRSWSSQGVQNGVDVVIAPEQIFYRRAAMY